MGKLVGVVYNGNLPRVGDRVIVDGKEGWIARIIWAEREEAIQCQVLFQDGSVRLYPLPVVRAVRAVELHPEDTVSLCEKLQDHRAFIVALDPEPPELEWYEQQLRGLGACTIVTARPVGHRIVCWVRRRDNRHTKCWLSELELAM